MGNQRIAKAVGVLALVLLGSSAIAGDIVYSNGVQNPKTGINGAGGSTKVNNGNADVSVTTFSFMGAGWDISKAEPKPPKKFKKHKRRKKHRG